MVTRQQTAGLAWIIAMAVALVLAMVICLFSITSARFKLLQKLVDRVNQVSRELLTGLLVIRAFSREKYEEQRFDRANTDLMKTQLFVNRAMSFMGPGMTLIMNLVTVGIIWFGAKQINMGNLMVGNMIAFITYTIDIVMSFMMISMVSIMLPRANVASDRIEEVLDTEPSIKDKDVPAAPPAQPKARFEPADADARFNGPADEENLFNNQGLPQDQLDIPAYIRRKRKQGA
jgi:ATP-binding cassette subfamily B protein